MPFEAIALLELRSQICVLRLQPPLLDRRVEHVQQLVDLKRLADEVPRAALDRFTASFTVPKPVTTIAMMCG
jgi:hypothetical protein